MLAVTKVNKCALCSYAHTKRALETGMSNEEIQKMLSGIIDDVPAGEVAAIMFAQSWQRIVEIYGISKVEASLIPFVLL